MMGKQLRPQRLQGGCCDPAAPAADPGRQVPSGFSPLAAWGHVTGVTGRGSRENVGRPLGQVWDSGTESSQHLQ